MPKAASFHSQEVAHPGSPNFEAAVAEVEAIIERIERGEIGLEQSVAEYERGSRLLKACRDRLALAEQRVKDLTEQMKSESKPVA
jgi:exodeoxyribonuclease VII small subunit